MAENRRPSFTVEWRIGLGMLKHIPHNTCRYDFLLQDLKNTAWRLGIEFDDCLMVYISRRREDVSDEKIVDIECDLYILVSEELDKPRSLTGNFPRKFIIKTFEKGEASEYINIVPRSAIEALKDDNVLLLCCHIWSPSSSFPTPVRHFVQCDWRCIECFTWTIKEFNSLQRLQKIPYALKKKETHSENVTFDLFLDDDNDSICISETSQEVYYFIHSISVVDSSGGKVFCLQNYFPFYKNDAPIKSIFLARKSKLLENGDKYLPNDQLTLYFVLRRGIFDGVVEKIVVGDPMDEGDITATNLRNVVRNDTDMLTTTTYYSRINSSYINEDLTLFPSHRADGSNFPHTCANALYELFKQGQFTDFELRIRSHSVRVHKNVLAARSSFFFDMLTNKMPESSYQAVDIEDIELVTVYHLLYFMYLDSVPDIDCNLTMKLYYVANKYGVVGLRKKCLEVLKSKLCVRQVCSILSLANTHTDNNLKEVAHDFILENWNSVIPSQEWEKFVKDDVHLAAQVMLHLCKKRIETELGNTVTVD